MVNLNESEKNNGTAIATIRLVMNDMIDRETARTQFQDDPIAIVKHIFHGPPRTDKDAYEVTILSAEMQWDE